MARHTPEELDNLRDAILERFDDVLDDLLLEYDQREMLEEFLSMLKMSSLLEIEEVLHTFPHGKIYLMGDSAVKEKDLIGISESLGISKDRIVRVQFNDTVNFDYSIFENNPKIGAVMFGPMPHKTEGCGDYSSVIARMEDHREMYPRVIRLMANGVLKITKTNFKSELKNLLDSGLLVAA